MGDAAGRNPARPPVTGTVQGPRRGAAAHGWLSRRHVSPDGRTISHHLYGAIIVLAVLITASDYDAPPFRAAAVLAVTVAVLLGMETYADVIGREVTFRRPLTRAERATAARDLITVTGAAELPLLFLVLAGFGVLTIRLGFRLATATTLAELFYYGYLARRLAGWAPRRAVLTGMLVAGTGVALAVGKGYVHF